MKKHAKKAKKTAPAKKPATKPETKAAAPTAKRAAPMGIVTPPIPYRIPTTYVAYDNPYNATAAAYGAGSTEYPLAGLRIGKRFAAVTVDRSR